MSNATSGNPGAQRPPGPISLNQVSPPYDTGNNITCLLAHRCALEGRTGIAMRRLGIIEPDYLEERAANGPPVQGASSSSASVAPAAGDDNRSQGRD